MKKITNFLKNHGKLFFNRIVALLTLELFILSQFTLPLYALPENNNTINNQVTVNEEIILDSYNETVYTDEETVISFKNIKLEIPAGALDEPVEIVIEELGNIEEINPGMNNITGDAVGYRFLPHGINFNKNIKVTIPYDTQKINSEVDLNSLYTYFYNEQKGYWERLERDNIDTENGLVTSLTTHFTDMINSTLTLPDSPEVLSFNPTSIKDIEAGDPGNGINLIEPPQANNQGTANLSYPVEIPPGRNGMQPQVNIQYNSDGGDNWLGLGWDIPVQSVSIDTRWGVPRYSATEETETYMLSGQQLTPLANRGELEPRQTEKIFHTRIEGSFNNIVRHGSLPSNYWWEVTDKNGTKFFYGGLPETGINNNAVLTHSQGGNIARWNLLQVRDTNGNCIDYTYVKVKDSGVGNGTGGIQGVQLYLKTIRYTGNVSAPGQYSVTFIRDRELGEERRPDVSIDARFGFKVVTADLLRRVEVKLNQTLIRSYQLNYTEGAFLKTLLASITQYGEDGEEFNSHEFEYYDEIRNNGEYYGFDSPDPWNTGYDNIRADLMGHGEATALGSTESNTVGGHLYTGLNFFKPSKDKSFGFKIGYSNTDNDGVVSLIDLNGDGLPDKVYKVSGKDYQNNGIYYRPNLSGPDGSTNFGLPQILNISDISVENSNTISFGFEEFFRFSVNINNNKTLTTSSIYFSDVNGDGLVDLVNGSQVLFNRLVNGKPTFYSDSAGTPVPVSPGNVDTDGLVSDLTDFYETQIDIFPLMDSVRQWKAPYDGQITVTAPVRLININRGEYKTADGVRVAIQHNGSEIWSDLIGADDYSLHTLGGPDGITLSVNKGDNIYFRVQSIFDGAYDRVEWNPAINYLNVPTGISDVNELDPYNYSASDDFIYFGRNGEIEMPFTGTLQLNGSLIKNAVISDNLKMVVYLNDLPVLDYSMTWDDSRPVSINDTLNVSELDILKFYIEADSPVDATQIECDLEAFYIGVDDPDITVTDQYGEPIIKFNPVVNMDLYPFNDSPDIQEYWEAPKDGTVVVSAGLIFNSSVLDYEDPGKITFTVKEPNTLLAKSRMSTSFLNELNLVSRVSLELDVSEGSRIYFDFSTIDPLLRSYMVGKEVKVYFLEDVPPSGDPVWIQVPGCIHNTINTDLFPQSYRGWSLFAYNGNRGRASQPIDESKLFIDDSYDASDAKVFIMFPFKENGFWQSDDPLCWISGSEISSSRKGMDYISVPNSDDSGESRAVEKFSISNNVSVGSGYRIFCIAGSEGTSHGEVDFMDINGDRFPDILGNGHIQYTTMTGGLMENNILVSGLTGKVRQNDNISRNFGVSGNPSIMIPNSEGDVVGSTKGVMRSLLSGIGITLNILGDGTSSADYDLIDINGDGLPDRVTNSGSQLYASLNLGYSFAPAEYWGDMEINRGTNKKAPVEFGFSPGFNSGDYGFGGGLSLSSSSSQVEESFNDINGDGLMDSMIKSGSVLYVRLNTGNGFTEPIEWHAAQQDYHLTDSDNVSLGGGAYITIPIPIYTIFTVFYIIINPGGPDISHSMGSQQSVFRDVNGDGFIDHVSSKNDGSMLVSLSQVGITNKLKTVNRPLGASFELNYKRDGNTYDMPQSRWVLDRINIHDGHTGDGADSQVMSFTYSGGVYNRLEREFLGYSEVVTERRDPSSGDELYLTMTKVYKNDSYYSKGLLESEIVKDADGRVFTETVNQYLLFDINTQSNFIDQYPNNTVATVFPQLIRTENYFYEGEVSPYIWTYKDYEYDEYGNITRFFDAGDLGSEDDVDAYIEYYKDTGKYIIGKPDNFRVYGDGILMRHREADYDPATGNMTELRQYLENGQAAVANIEYYDNGNLKKITGPVNQNAERYSTSFEYDPVLNTYITAVSDSFGYTSESEYNFLYGLEELSVDINGNRMIYQYDNFGRLTQVFAPYDNNIPAVEFEYFHDELPARAVTHNKLYFDPDNNEALDTVLFVDGLKRVIQTKKEGEVLVQGNSIPDYGMNVTGKAVFDFMGRVIEQGQPVFEPGYNTEFYNNIPLKNPTINDYDILGRTTGVTLPDMSEINTDYSIQTNMFKIEVTDPEGNVNVSYKDVNNNVVRIDQYNDGDDIITQYKYNALNELVRITDDQGNITSMAYDLLGRRTSVNNPDRGLVESYYDLAGNLTMSVDNNLRENGWSINYFYEYNRLLRIDYPESTDVEYFYGGPGAEYNRAGRISKLTDESGITEMFYGKLGEEVKNIKTMNFLVPGHEPWTFETESGFDYLGRVQWLKYPDGEKLYYEYDAGGQIKSAYGEKQGDRYDYVKDIYYDEFGQRVYIKYGNDVETHYTYDPYRRWLSSIGTSNSQGDVFQDNIYTFDSVGNVLEIENSARDITQSFQYDDLYQLVRAEGESPDQNKTSSYMQTFEYDSIGNMINKTSFNQLTPGNNTPKELNYDFSYFYGGSKPHAPTQIGDWVYEYDANGNTAGKQRITGNNDIDGIEGGGVSAEYIWNEENRLKEAKVNGSSTYFLYNSAGERTIKRGQNGETLYVNNFYQLQNRQEVTKHIFVGTTRMVSKLSHYHNPNGLYDSGYEKNNIYTYHPDHLGSSSYISGPDGTEFEHIEYTPYGETWIDEGTNKNIIGYRFTGKELDQETGLYYFGARYLDPQVNRWMSPDPKGFELINPMEKNQKGELVAKRNYSVIESLNWYSFCRNNPVKYTDPTGLDDEAFEAYNNWLNQWYENASPEDIKDLNLSHFLDRVEAIYASGGDISVEGLNKEASNILEEQRDPVNKGVNMIAQGILIIFSGYLMNKLANSGSVMAETEELAAGGNETGYTLNKNWKNWENYMTKRGWSESSISEALTTEGIPHAGKNFLNPGNPMTRFVNPTTGQSLIQDSVTGEIIQLGGAGFKW